MVREIKKIIKFESISNFGLKNQDRELLREALMKKLLFFFRSIKKMLLEEEMVGDDDKKRNYLRAGILAEVLNLQAELRNKSFREILGKEEVKECELHLKMIPLEFELRGDLPGRNDKAIKSLKTAASKLGIDKF